MPDWLDSWMTTRAAEPEGQPCPYCERSMVPGTSREPTTEHVYPRVLGGTLSGGNKLIVCLPCNNEKGRMTLPDFLGYLRERGDPRAKIVNELIRSRTEAKVGIRIVGQA